ncbi:MAG: DUF4249 domain-containing protein [Vicingaceae bacterium]
MKKLLYTMLVSFTFMACEDVIDVDLDQGQSQLVVDAFITNDSSLQTVRLTKSADYFLNAPTPSVTKASVKIQGPGLSYNFVSDNQGNYQYNPQTSGAIDSIGFPYKLEIQYENKTYTSISVLNPVPKIDSMTRSFEEEELGQEEGYYSQFWAQDFPGRDDYYWIKAYKNDSAINALEPSSLILSQNAAFSGNAADGLIFILPIRAAITNEEKPLEVGDTSIVELLSINADVFEFLEQLTIQANNGGLFSTPPANIRSNIKDAFGNPQDEVLGVFSVSAIETGSLIITAE